MTSRRRAVKAGRCEDMEFWHPTAAGSLRELRELRELRDQATAANRSA